VKYQGITTWAYSFTDNRVSMALVSYDAQNKVMGNVTKDGARYVWNVISSGPNQTVMFEGQAKQRVSATWANWANTSKLIGFTPAQADCRPRQRVRAKRGPMTGSSGDPYAVHYRETAEYGSRPSLTLGRDDDSSIVQARAPYSPFRGLALPPFRQDALEFLLLVGLHLGGPFGQYLVQGSADLELHLRPVFGLLLGRWQLDIGAMDVRRHAAAIALADALRAAALRTALRMRWREA